MQSSSSEPRKAALFMIRIWQEPSASGAAIGWRASVEHVGSGQRLATSDFADVGDFIAHRMSDAPPLIVARPGEGG